MIVVIPNSDSPSALVKSVVAGIILIGSILSGSGCSSVQPAVLVGSKSAWNNDRAFAAINASTEPGLEGWRKSRRDYIAYFGPVGGGASSRLIDSQLNHVADANGLTAIEQTWQGPTDTSVQGNYSISKTPVQGRLHHITYSDISEVKLKTTTEPSWLSWIILPALITPFVDDYEVQVVTKDQTLTYTIANPRVDRDCWYWFPCWIVRPLHFVNNTNHLDYVESHELAAAFEYLRSTNAGNPKEGGHSRERSDGQSRRDVPIKSSTPRGSETITDVDWAQVRKSTSNMTVEQAAEIVRSSLELTGRELVQDDATKDSTFVIERVDRGGFSFKMDVVRRQSGITMKVSLPKEVYFNDVAKLGIKKIPAGREGKVVLLADSKKQLWELPFSSVDEKDSLLSALMVLCGHLTPE